MPIQFQDAVSYKCVPAGIAQSPICHVFVLVWAAFRQGRLSEAYQFVVVQLHSKRVRVPVFTILIIIHIVRAFQAA